MDEAAKKVEQVLSHSSLRSVHIVELISAELHDILLLLGDKSAAFWSEHPESPDSGSCFAKVRLAVRIVAGSAGWLWIINPTLINAHSEAVCLIGQ